MYLYDRISSNKLKRKYWYTQQGWISKTFSVERKQTQKLCLWFYLNEVQKVDITNLKL